ncbi:MAG: deoxyribose-phosphate aldolase [Solirubrobacteraceae bacterium]
MLEPRQMIALVDLTSLTGEETDAEIAALCAQAQTPAGPVAAVCVYGRYVPRAVAELEGSGIPVAAVANFPEGDLNPERAVRETEQAIADGAREIDVVLPWRAFAAGDRAGAMAVVEATREACPVLLKVILESGLLREPELIGAAARDALAVGADFVKTSTGKVQPAATLAAAAVMLEAVRDHGLGGFKASGGIRTAEEAAEYLELTDALLGPEWATPRTFRFGASSLLADLLRERD